MALKEFWSQTGRWMRTHNPLVTVAARRPEIGDDGLIRQNASPLDQAIDGSPRAEALGDEITVRAVPQVDRHESLEKLQQGFDKLVEQLQGINEHLSRQASQHDNLMGRLEQLPQLLGSFPSVVENQKRVTEQLLERLKNAAAKNEQFIDAVEKIPAETAKQTDALVNIDHQLGANQSTVSQTDGIVQMSKTFAASDRYLKYIISRQNKRFMWIFVAAISICATAILILTGVIIYLRY